MVGSYTIAALRSRRKRVFRRARIQTSIPKQSNASNTMDIELFRRLCETPGIPGREGRVRALIAKETKGLFDSCETDAMGSLICTRKPTRKLPKGAKPVRVMLAAHMDEIGFFVRHVDENGCIWVNPAGGFDARNLFASRVLVCTPKGDLKGVMNPGGKPIHISSEAERTKVPGVEEFFIDLGRDCALEPAQVRDQC
jgi:endoglucanase